MSEVKDVIELLAGFEEDNGVKVAIAVSRVVDGKAPTLFLTANAFLLDPEGRVAMQLASVSATCSGMQAKTMLGALTQMLYKLDGEFAKIELGHAGNI